LDVHADVEHVSAIETAGRKWQGERAAMLVGNLVLQSHALREGFGCANVFLSEVNGRHSDAFSDLDFPT